MKNQMIRMKKESTNFQIFRPAGMIINVQGCKNYVRQTSLPKSKYNQCPNRSFHDNIISVNGENVHIFKTFYSQNFHNLQPAFSLGTFESQSWSTN